MSLEVEVSRLEDPSEEVIAHISYFLGEAFKAEGIMIPMLGGNMALSAPHFEAHIRSALLGGEAWVAIPKGSGPEQSIACALWYPPGKEFMDVKDKIPLRAQVDSQISSETQQWKSEKFYPIYTSLTASSFGTFEARRGKHYLHILGCDPAFQRRGVARKLISHGIARADANGWETSLETCKEQNVVFYKSVGLEAVGEGGISSPFGDLTMTVLRRFPPIRAS